VATRKLIVTALDELTSGESDNGRAWRLFAVAATTPEGVPIAQPLRTFDARLPTGEVLEVEVEPHESRGRTTYTIKRPRRRGAATAALEQDLGELRGRVDDVEGRVGRLEHHVREPTLPLTGG
jgi:hypothetical protein